MFKFRITVSLLLLLNICFSTAGVDQFEYITTHSRHIDVLKDSIQKAKPGTKITIVSPYLRKIKLEPLQGHTLRNL